MSPVHVRLYARGLIGSSPSDSPTAALAYRESGNEEVPTFVFQWSIEDLPSSWTPAGEDSSASVCIHPQGA